MLELKDVSVEFVSENSVLAVDNMSMQLADGSKTAIVGETGSGKSVLLLAVLRLLPSNARVSGSILLNGEEILTAEKKRLRQIRGGEISYIPQGGGASMNPLMKVGYQVGEPLMEHRGYRKRRAVEAGTALLRKFNLIEEERLARSYPHTFSGGMRQRAMVAMGIAAGAGIVLADEPTKGLDKRRIALVAEAMGMLEKETLLCVTHDMNFAKTISGNICVMYAAQQVEYGTAEEVLENPLHPYTCDMIQAMPENGMKYEDAGFAPSHGSYLHCDTGCRYQARCRERMECCMRTPPLADVNGHKVRCWKYAAGDKKADEKICKCQGKDCL